MGEVFRAKDTRLDRDVAVKVLPPSFASEPERQRRFEQEARAVAALDHPNVLVVNDVGAYDGRPYIVTELLEGESLGDRLRAGRLPPRKAVEIAVQVARRDVFSLGAVLYEMLAGRRPFAGATPADTISAILREDPPPIEGSSGASPSTLDRVVRRCLE